jgi:hypothetical protein
MPDRCVFRMALAGRNRADHHLAGTHPDAGFDWRVAGLAQLRRVPAHLVQHSKGSVKRALRMILVRCWRSEQREDPIARGLRHIAAVMMDCIHHQLQCRIDDSARLFGVEILNQLH